ncbi:mycothiol transferase [Ornithinimicrobium avium]|uniref:DUF664 domain-containing protein n=1 Tax=Ornithinimicrobium avium TaxID=2283195 RepID=A0A345NM24_9MICO|nr:DUF664 domain-containing protein [Ornithinimicrobium avium]AXH96082.1 DUF664 domain-containing protein [Ornithinimicrobium avium]
MTRQLTDEDYLSFVDTALDGMLQTCRELGDRLANERLSPPGSNTPYAIVVHCVGVMDFWGGHKVAGRPNHRDRDAEFRASGTLDQLEALVRQGRARLAETVAGADWSAPCVGQDRPETHARPAGRTQGGALVHVLEEVVQHRGQLEVTADVLRSR